MKYFSWWLGMSGGVILSNALLSSVDVISWDTFSAIYWTGAAFLICRWNERSSQGKEANDER